MRTSPASGARFVKSSVQSLLVYFDALDSTGVKDGPRGKTPAEGNNNVRKLLQLLNSQPLSGVCNLHPAYCSLLVKFDARKLRHEELEEKLRELLGQLEGTSLPESGLVEIPVCYGGEFGPDLEDVARMHGISAEETVRLHTSATYRVYFLGFVPGFAYLGELPDALATPRHPTPRRKVPPGSVGIAGKQTGVYPCETPGGWRLLGRTPLGMFRPDRQDFSLLSIGDRVHFKAISREEYAAHSQKRQTA